MLTYTLFDYQEQAIAEVIDFFAHGGRSCVLNLPTGTGKSLVAVEFVKRARELNKPVYFVTHSRNLLTQFSDHLTEFGLDHGLIASGCPTLGYRVQVISAQSLKSRIGRIAAPAYLIFEEAHHSTAPMFKDILKAWPEAKLLGLTATPERPDGTPLNDIYEKIIYSKPVRWFIDNCYLADYDYYVPVDFDTSCIHRVRGDFNNKELEEAVQRDAKRVGNLVEYYKKYADSKPAIAFATSIADSEIIAQRFIDAGYDMKALHSKMSGSIIDELRRCRIGDLSMISSCEAIGEGTDVKGLTAMIDARPTQSLVVQLQHCGRVLRAKYADGYDLQTLTGRRAAMEAGGKGKAKILDFSSNYLRHGLPDDEREWSLDGKVKKSTASAYKRCPNCQRPVPNFVKTCPFCGHEFITYSQPEEVTERDAELVSITSIPKPSRNAATLDVGRNAKSMKDAVVICKKYGINQQGAWFIWRMVWKNNA